MPPMAVHAAYMLLNLSPSDPVTEATITRQYRKLAKVTHPDKSTDKVQAHLDFIRLKDAYDVVIRDVQNRGTGGTQKGQPQMRQQRKEDINTQRERQAEAGGNPGPQPEPQRDQFQFRSEWWDPWATETEWAEWQPGDDPILSLTRTISHNPLPIPNASVPPLALIAPLPPPPRPLKCASSMANPILPSMLETIRVRSSVFPPAKYTRRWTWGDLKDFLQRYPVKKWLKEAVLEVQILLYPHLVDRNCRAGGGVGGGEREGSFEQEGNREREKGGSEEACGDEQSEEDGESAGEMSDISDIFAE